jgi:hypothetical protein
MVPPKNLTVRVHPQSRTVKNSISFRRNLRSQEQRIKIKLMKVGS